MLKKILKKIYFFVIGFFVNKKHIIMRVDGGICSQMHQYVFGQLLNNPQIRYDITWFSYNGYDLLHKDKRNYDLEKLFPYLNVPKASFNEVKYYREYYITDETDIEKIKKLPLPICLDNYYSIPEKDYESIYNKLFNLNSVNLDYKNAAFAEKIRSCSSSCAVHVRRGDLADKAVLEASDAYSHGVCSDSYFFNTIEYISNKYKDTVFFFFSDDIEYVKNNLIPFIKNNKCVLADINSPEYGYMDLYLIAQCHHQIGSIGSLGITGYFLNTYSDKTLITNNKEYFNIVKNCVLFDNAGNLIKTSCV